MGARFKLRLDSLKFVSLVDRPAQETATIRLIKRDGADHEAINATARVMKIGDGPDPLIWTWAFTCTKADGSPYGDLQGDWIQEDFIKAAEEFLRDGARGDEMHSREQTTRVAFALPMLPDIAKAFFGEDIGSQIKTSGLMIAIRAPADVVAKVRSGEYTGVSIDGFGTRETIKTVWSTADIDNLADSAFLYIEPGGEKDKDGKTTPRSLRHFPYKDASGAVDLPHLRNAIARIPQSSLPADLRDKLQKKAEKLLAAQHSDDVGKAKPKPKKKPPMAPDASAPSYKRVGKMAVLTSVTEGHAHSVDLDDPADCWSDHLMTSYQTADGATESHCHAWIYDSATGKITIAPDSGHTHTLEAVVPADVIAEAMADDDDSDCIPCAVEDEESSAAVIAVQVNARAPQGNSPPQATANTVKSKEQVMATEHETQIASLRKMLSTALALTEPQRLHVVKMAPTDVDAFLALDATGREAALNAADAADPEVYKTAAGLSIRKSDGPVAEAIAKQADAQALIIKAQTEQLALQKAAAEQATFEKRASTELSHFAKGVNVGASILKAVEGISDEAVRKDALEALKGANVAMQTVGKAIGSDEALGGGPKPDDPASKLTEMAIKHAEVNKTSFAKAYDAVLSTAEGAALYDQLNKAPTLRVV